MNNQVNITAVDRLRSWAKEEIERYRNEIRTGEPPFPQYAYDVMEVLDELEAAKEGATEGVTTTHRINREPGLPAFLSSLKVEQQ